MTNKTSSIKFLALCALLVQGCATSGPPRQASVEGSTEATVSNDLRHTIVAGDRLSDIALRYTGDLTQWRSIAEHNSIENPRALKIGQEILIPFELTVDKVVSLDEPRLRSVPTAGEATNPLDSTNRESMDAAVSSAGSKGLTPAGGLALQRSVEGDSSDTEEVIVQSVSINRTFELNPIKPASIDSLPSSNSVAPQVKVSGTYYPKGIYRQPASYAQLIFRAAPGTVFDLESEINDWYKIVTDQGIGYLRVVDGKMLGDN